MIFCASELVAYCYTSVRRIGERVFDAGDVVYILSERQGTENGWTKVLWMPENAMARVDYIWWSFLEKAE